MIIKYKTLLPPPTAQLLTHRIYCVLHRAFPLLKRIKENTILASTPLDFSPLPMLCDISISPLAVFFFFFPHRRAMGNSRQKAKQAWAPSVQDPKYKSSARTEPSQMTHHNSRRGSLPLTLESSTHYHSVVMVTSSLGSTTRDIPFDNILCSSPVTRAVNLFCDCKPWGEVEAFLQV